MTKVTTFFSIDHGKIKEPKEDTDEMMIMMHGFDKTKTLNSGFIN